MSVEILIRADAFEEEQLAGNGPIHFSSHHQTGLSTAALSQHMHTAPSSPHLVNEVDIGDNDNNDECVVGDGDDEDEHHHMWKKSRFKLMKNLFILSVSCMAMQTAFLVNNTATIDRHKLISANHVSSLISSVDSTTNTQSTLWIVVVLEKFIKIFDCLILPQYLIKKIGCKSTIFVSFLSYVIFYLTTKFYPFTYASYLGVFFNELLGNSFWVASLVYLADLAYIFIKVTLFPKEFTICLFYSTFYGLFYTSFTWNALIRGNYTTEQAYMAYPNSSDSTSQKFESDKMFNFIIALLSVFGALLTLLFLTRLNEKKILLKENNLKQFFNVYQWFIVPITLYLGMFQAFCFEYINDSLNKNASIWDGFNIPIIVYSISILFCAIVIPFIRKLISFNFIMILSILANNLAILAVLLIKPEGSILFRLTIPILLGLAASSLEIILTCYYALLFRGNEVTSFSFFILCKTFGILIGLAINLTMLIECFIFIVILAIGLVLHFVIIFFN